MKSILCVLITTFLFSTTIKSQQKLSEKQRKLSVFIKKYQNDIRKAPDSKSKMKVYNEMWWKHMIFIQDSLKFSTYPTYTLDPFYFKKVTVMQKRNDTKNIKVLLENENYEATAYYDFTNVSNLQSIPIYRMLMNLHQDVPVLAVIHLQDFSLTDKDIDKGSRKLNLAIALEAIYNAK